MSRVYLSVLGGRHHYCGQSVSVPARHYEKKQSRRSEENRNSPVQWTAKTGADKTKHQKKCEKGPAHQTSAKEKNPSVRGGAAAAGEEAEHKKQHEERKK